MKKSELVFVGGKDGIPLSGYCSSCPDVNFSLPKDLKHADLTQQQAFLRTAFGRHSIRRHRHEDAPLPHLH
jgi:hypothetical protein